MTYGKTYRPSKFVIGYRDRELSSGEKRRAGYPTCKWLNEGKWTELSKFSSHTGGYKPHKQLDAEKQMQKDLGMKLEEIDNVPVSGFQLVDVYHSYRADGSYCAVRDPRGFDLLLDESFPETALLKYHLGITGKGEIDGKWFYLWKDGRFAGIYPESELVNVKVDDTLLEEQSKKLESFTVDTLEVGKVYDMAAKNGDKTDVARVVYLGQKSMPSLPTVRNFFNAGYHLNKLGPLWKNKLSYGVNDEKDTKLPWNDEADAKKAKNVMKPWKLVPAFILLKDAISSWNDQKMSYYCEDLAGVPEDEKEHSVRFCVTEDAEECSILAGQDIVKRLVNKSECQDLRILAKALPWSRQKSHYKEDDENKKYAYSSPKEYKTVKLETLQLGVGRWLEKVRADINCKLELAPAERPADLNAWREKVRKWYNEVYEPEHRRSSYGYW